MPVAERTARVTWEGNLIEGRGELTTQSSETLIGVPVTWAARTEAPSGQTSPEEMLAAAHAACYAMGMSATLDRQGSPPERLDVTATCAFDKREDGGYAITTMTLQVLGVVPGIDQATFERAAAAADETCPVSNALRGNVRIDLKAELGSNGATA